MACVLLVESEPYPIAIAPAIEAVARVPIAIPPYPLAVERCPKETASVLPAVEK